MRHEGAITFTHWIGVLNFCNGALLPILQGACVTLSICIWMHMPWWSSRVYDLRLEWVGTRLPVARL